MGRRLSRSSPFMSRSSFRRLIDTAVRPDIYYELEGGVIRLEWISVTLGKEEYPISTEQFWIASYRPQESREAGLIRWIDR